MEIYVEKSFGTPFENFNGNPFETPCEETWDFIKKSFRGVNWDSFGGIYWDNLRGFYENPFQKSIRPIETLRDTFWAIYWDFLWNTMRLLYNFLRWVYLDPFRGVHWKPLGFVYWDLHTEVCGDPVKNYIQTPSKGSIKTSLQETLKTLLKGYIETPLQDLLLPLLKIFLRNLLRHPFEESIETSFNESF